MKRYTFSYPNIQLGVDYSYSVTLPAGRYIREVFYAGNENTPNNTMSAGRLGLYLYNQADEYRQSGFGVVTYETRTFNTNGQPFNLNFRLGPQGSSGNVTGITFIFTRISA